MAYRRNSNLHQLAYALEKRADFLEEAKEWIADNPELAAGLLGGTLGAGGGALIPTEDGAGGRVRNALIGALLGGGVGAGAGYLGKDQIKELLGGGDKPMNPLQTLEGAKALAQQESFDNTEKWLREKHHAIPPEAQPVPVEEFLDQFGSTNAMLNDVGNISTQEEQLENFSNSDKPIRYTNSNTPDTNTIINSLIRTIDRTHS